MLDQWCCMAVIDKLLESRAFDNGDTASLVQYAWKHLRINNVNFGMRKIFITEHERNIWVVQLGRKRVGVTQGRLHVWSSCVLSVRVIAAILLSKYRGQSILLSPSIVWLRYGKPVRKATYVPQKTRRVLFSFVTVRIRYYLSHFLSFSRDSARWQKAESHAGSMIGYAMCYFWHTWRAVSKKRLAWHPRPTAPRKPSSSPVSPRSIRLLHPLPRRELNDRVA